MTGSGRRRMVVPTEAETTSVADFAWSNAKNAPMVSARKAG